MMNFIPNSMILKNINTEAYLCLIDGRRILMAHDGTELPKISPDGIGTTWQIGILNGIPCLAMPLLQWKKALPNNSGWKDFRTVFHICDAATAFAVARSAELLSWRSMHRFCGRCGVELNLSNSEIALRCPSCSALYYPQIAPAVITLITRGNDEILLAHNRRFADGVHSLIAGFVEAGETVEQAVHREIKEEIGITVKNLRYISSQCWPYPNSLMLAFTAEYDSGVITPDGMEIEHAAFYTRSAMPQFPAPGSIASTLITDWLNRH